MATALVALASSAHSMATSLLSAAEVKVGSTIPIKVPVKESAPNESFTFENISGKSVIVGVPGAFTGTCSKQVPGYIDAFEQFKAKGIDNIFVVAVNDVFVMKAWKASLAPQGTPVRFIADDQGAFVGALGMLFDASPLLGGPRSKRFVLVVDGDTISHLAVEAVPSELTTTAADKVLPWL
ncbi:Redoxin [Epithele typhae]|uniref:Redoxin n=1 Tax=Epithele typhae TaxID=378194 RepID=UPI00200870F9|nr:Redoxin [Epithele typhae]KAH9939706.1 Redoxin [Epithele typhae]